MWTIAKLSFKEILYKKIFLIALLMTLAYLLLYGIATHFAGASYLEDMERMATAGQEMLGMQKYVFASQLLSTGLFFSNFIVGLLAVLASVGSVAGMIESHQIDPVITRPLRRSELILGKYIGLGSLLTGYAILFFTSIILINQCLGGPFAVELTSEQIIKAGAIFACIPLTIIAPAMLMSTCFSTLNSGIILIILYGMSYIGGFIEQLGNLINKISLVNIGILTSLVLPADTMFRGMNHFLFYSHDDPFYLAGVGLFWGTTPPSALMLIYCLIYIVLVLTWAARTFTRRDI